MKLKKLKAMMESMEIDAMLITYANNIYYLSGFKGTAGTLFVTGEQTYLITDFRYITQAKEQAAECEIIDIAAGAPSIYQELVKKHNIKSVGFERDHITYTEFVKYSELFKGMKLLATEGMVEQMRIVKTANELEYIEKACDIADEAFECVFTKIKAGMSELEIAAMLEYEMKRRGATGTSFETIVASGVRSAMPHGTAGTKLLEKGDFAVMDFGCIYAGYCSDITRTVAIGSVSDKQRDVYEKLLDVQSACLGKVSAGTECKEVDRYSRNMLGQWELDSFFGHSLGHGVGLDIHESPNLSPNSPYLLEKNMVVTVEPGVYIEGEFGIRIEDTVAVTENGARRLTKSSKELKICN
ncbi:MAG: Xaa-Pro peptidase family protein [Bacillota bacterium]|nr:Xaa-Pro peptidase family protein [Bacillota bacterium]